MCGIAAVSLKKNLTQAQLDKVAANLKILALYNDERGGDGCGIYINGEIHKGHNDIKGVDTRKMADLMAQENFDSFNIQQGSVIILHTRKSSVGFKKSAENNHPFYIESDDKKKEIIGVHNGTIRNHWDLAKEFNIKYSDYDVDSHLLYMIMSEHGYDVLEKYKGTAALCWTYPIKPDELYMFHGAAKETANGKLIEERPLYFLSTDEGVYLSSIEKSLNAIKDKNSKKQVTVLAHNKIFKIKNGIISGNNKNLVQEINREDANLYQPYKRNVNNKFSQTDDDDDDEFFDLYGYTQRNPLAHNIQQGVRQSKMFHEPEHLNPEMEILPLKVSTAFEKKEDKVFVYFHKLRHWIYPGMMLAEGKIRMDKKGFIYDINHHSPNTEVNYFCKGVKIKTEEAYLSLKQRKQNEKDFFLNDPDSNFAMHISGYTEEPVCLLTMEAPSHMVQHTKDLIWLDEKRCKSISRPFKLTPRMYHINDGFLEKITSSDNKEKNKNLIEKNYASSKVPFNFNRVETKQKDVFDKICSSVDQLSKSFSSIEMQALIATTAETLSKEFNYSLIPDNEEIDNEVLLIIRKAVNQKKSIREVMSEEDVLKLNITLQLVKEMRSEDDENVSYIDDLDRVFNQKQNNITTQKGTEHQSKSVIPISEVEVIEEDESPDDNSFEEAEEQLEEIIKGKIQDITTSLNEITELCEDLSTFLTSNVSTELGLGITQKMEETRKLIMETEEKYNINFSIDKVLQ